MPRRPHDTVDRMRSYHCPRRASPVSTNRRSKGLAIFLAGIALLLIPWAGLGLLSLQSRTATLVIPPGSIDSDSGKGFLAPLRAERLLGKVQGLLFEFPCDHAGGQLSRLRLFEDDREIGPAHAPHGEIREFGEGRFSHWDRNLYFSSSDGRDARDGSRVYRIETPVDLSRAAGLIALALSLAGALLAWMSPFAQARTAPWRARWLDATAGLRTAVAPLPQGWRVVLVLAWISAAGTAALIGRGEHGAYLLSTVPTAGFSDASNALPGYAVFLDGVPRHQENMQTWDHVAMFNGSRIAADMYANRPLFPFLVSCFAWALGVGGASLLVNLLAWALGTWAAVRVAAEIAHAPRAGIVAGLLACVGAGWWFHVDDYSAHQLSFATSALALLVLVRSRVWARAQPAEVHAAIASVLVLASLAYNSGLFFTAAYVLLALRRNRWWHVLLVAIAAIAVQRAWTPLLNRLSDGSFDYYAVERQLFDGAMKIWPQWFHEGSWWRRAWDVFVDTLVPYATVIPLLVIGAIAPLFGGVERGARRATTAAPPALPAIDGGAVLLLFLTIAFPILATIVYSPTATARGYLVFGASTAVWALAGLVAARLRRGPWLGVGAGCLLLGLAAQGLFDTAHARGDARAVKLYMWGQHTWNRETLADLRDSRPSEVLGFAGEPAPRIAGGNVSMIDVGGATGGERSVTLPAFESAKAFVTLPAFKNGIQLGQMLVVRGVLILALAAALHLLDLSGLLPARWWRRRGVALIAIAVLLFVPPVLTRWRRGGPELARHDLYDRALPRRASTVTFEIDVHPSRLLRLEQALRGAPPDPSSATAAPMLADLLTGFGWSDKKGAGVNVEVFAGATSIARFDTEGSGRRRREIDLEALVQALRADPRLRVVAERPDGITSVASWQRGDLEGRRLRLDDDAPRNDPAIPAPILEVRVWSAERPYDPVLLLY